MAKFCSFRSGVKERRGENKEQDKTIPHEAILPGYVDYFEIFFRWPVVTQAALYERAGSWGRTFHSENSGFTQNLSGDPVSGSVPARDAGTDFPLAPCGAGSRRPNSVVGHRDGVAQHHAGYASFFSDCVS